LKAPLIIISWQAGIYSGIATSFLKVFVLAIKTSDEFDNLKVFFTYFAFLMAAVHLTMQIRTLNKALRFYD
jgi:hypothetical protein